MERLERSPLVVLYGIRRLAERIECAGVRGLLQQRNGSGLLLPAARSW